MIDESKLLDAILDALERVGDIDNYYRLNHAGVEKIARLRRFLKFWLNTI